MRVVDLDRDMTDVIPTGTTLDSDYLFEQMTERTLALALAAPGRRVLDVASGVGQDSLALARSGAFVVGAEPSERMTGMARLFAERQQPEAVPPAWVRGWSDQLPFATGSFDAAVCKGAIDHFDRPVAAIAEMARVVRSSGRVVLAVANFESMGCRLSRFSDDWRGVFGRRRGSIGGRRKYDVPSDHFTRYELELMREQMEPYVEIDVVEGISVGWGAPGWANLLARLPERQARFALQALDGLARRVPAIADVVVLAGCPRRSASTSS